jgi:hypothetical protein
LSVGPANRGDPENDVITNPEGPYQHPHRDTNNSPNSIRDTFPTFSEKGSATSCNHQSTPANMAIEKTSAHGADPQPIPKEQVTPTKIETHLDEAKLKKYFIGAIDQGTTSTRFIIFNGIGEPVAQHQIEFTQMYPESG